MDLKVIKTKKQYHKYLDFVDEKFNRKVKANNPEGKKVFIALSLIKQYEDANYPIPLPNTIKATL